MNNQFNTQKPMLRPLPGGMPEYIAAEVFKSEFKGRPQWSARYKLYSNGTESDFIDVVVNLPRHFWPWPEDGELMWIKPTAMAPYKRLVFAEAYGRVDHHDKPLTVRTGEELFLTFERSRQYQYQTSYDGWQVVLRDGYGICPGESWQVQVTNISPTRGVIEVRSVGPHPKTFYEPPTQVGLMSVIPLLGERDVMESDVFSYSRFSFSARNGWEFHAEIEHAGQIVRLHCSALRKLRAGYNKEGKVVEKIVGLVCQNGTRTYLAELVLVEGETAAMPKLHTSEMRSVGRRMEAYEPGTREYEDDLMHDLIAEIRANTDHPDYDY